MQKKLFLNVRKGARKLALARGGFPNFLGGFWWWAGSLKILFASWGMVTYFCWEKPGDDSKVLFVAVSLGIRILINDRQEPLLTSVS